MKSLQSTLAGLTAGCLLTIAAHASDEVALEGAKPGQWTMDYEAAVKLAAEKELPMMLNFTGSDWCGWCKLMDKEVFAKEEWKKFAAENVILVTVDFPKDKSIVPEKFVARNNELKKQFGIRGYPTIWFIDSDGEKVAFIPGYVPPDEFLAALKYIQTKSYDEMSFEEFLELGLDRLE